MKQLTLTLAASLLMLLQACTAGKLNEPSTKINKAENFTFQLSESVTREKVVFKNRYGITIAGHLYVPKNMDKTKKYAALVLSGPFGAVKEQSSGLYANEMAKRGFIALAFDPSFTGESGGAVRNVASPDIFTEDFSAAVDYLGLQSYVDRNKIGALAICGLSGMAITAAATDSRIKAVATASMYDMSRSISKSYKDSYTKEQRHKILENLSQQRWIDAEKGTYALGFHEIPFNENGDLVKGDQLLPEKLPENPDPVSADFHSYYKTKRGYHSRSINSNTAWTATTPLSFFSFPMYANLDLLAPRPILLIAGENAHSRYYSEDVYKIATGPKELIIVPGATHCDLYDKVALIPFDQLDTFFTLHLK